MLALTVSGVGDSRMLYTRSMQAQKIFVLREHDAPLGSRAPQVLVVGGAQEIGFGYREHIHPTLPQTADNGPGHVFIGVEANWRTRHRVGSLSRWWTLDGEC